MSVGHALAKRPRYIFGATLPLNNSGSIDLLANTKAFYYYWYTQQPTTLDDVFFAVAQSLEACR